MRQGKTCLIFIKLFLKNANHSLELQFQWQFNHLGICELLSIAQNFNFIQNDLKKQDILRNKNVGKKCIKIFKNSKVNK